MNSALRRRMAAIERHLPPVLAPQPTPADRLISIYETLLPCAKRAAAVGKWTPQRVAEMKARLSQWKEARRTDPVGAAQSADLALIQWRARLLPIIERLRKGESAN